MPRSPGGKPVRLPHPDGIPLRRVAHALAYREPDGTEDDLRGTDLQEQFYAYLEGLPADTKVIVVENTNPPAGIMARDQSQMFGKNPHHGRYGLFPYLSESGQ